MTVEAAILTGIGLDICQLWDDYLLSLIHPRDNISETSPTVHVAPSVNVWSCC